jgi:type IV pilus assembly protein PilY1
VNIRKSLQRITTTAASAFVLVMTVLPAEAAPLGISDVPLFLSASVKPNLMMAIDDSGSMDFELLLPGNDGSAWWRGTSSGNCSALIDNNSFVGCIADGTTDQPGAGRLNFNNAGNANTSWKKFAYLFPNGSGGITSDRRRSGDGTNDHYAIPPIPAFAWARSSDHNKAYFDPTTVYTPWPNGGGFTFTNATPTAARFDPVFTGYGTIDLTRDFAGNGGVLTTAVCSDAALGAVSANHYFRVYTGMTIPAGTCIRSTNPARSWETVRATGSCQVGVTSGCLVTTSSGVNQTYTLANNSSVAIRYFPATFYLSAASAPPASFGYTAVPAVGGLAPDGTALLRYEIKPGNFASTAQYDAALGNFANWFSYNRKRHQALRAGLGTAFQSLTATRVGGFTINGTTGTPPTGPDVAMGDIDVVANRDALYTNFYQNWVATGGTPNRIAVANLIRNFERDDGSAPITHSCQRNFGMLFTDGFSNPPAANDGINGVAGNADGTAGAPFQDSTSDTLADAVFRAYNESLRPDLPQGRVIAPSACSSASPDPRLDCKRDPHMNFYAITLGTRGLQFNPDVPVDPFVTAPTWPTTFPARHPSAVDDIWHATINGRGQLLNASSSAELADKLGSVLRSIIERVGSASSAAVNSGSINSDTRLFQASFDSKDWSGKLTARDVNTDGSLGSEVLGTLPAPNSREIITVNSSGAAVPFRWASLDTTRQADLQPSDTNGAQRLLWLRGEQTNEIPAALGLRARTVLLGDIINSAPAFVGAPAFRYSDSLESQPYSTFRTTYRNRPHMVYAGANDGMLHGFFSDDAATNGALQERLAFIPGAVFRNLSALTSPTYSHRYYVDGTPVTGDAFINGAWRTMLVAGLNKGGQGIYALDITDPSTFSEANASSIFRWEFSDVDDVDLGLTYARPSIVRLNTGEWAAVFGNGYNNTLADGRASTTGNAVLYVVNLETGELIRKIDTTVGTADDPTGANRPNGLSTPVLVDVDGDVDADYAYAGDIFGNVWKFNISSGASSTWTVSYGAPLFSATDSGGNAQAITSRPNVSRGPNGQGLIVLVGTGKYLEAADTTLATIGTQSFYGLFDPNTGLASDRISGRGVLTEQTIDAEVSTAEGDLRVTSANTVAGTSRGWFIDLVSPSGFQGEMQVTDSLLRSGSVVFTTLVPNTDPCEFGGSSWLMEMNLFTGSRLDSTPFDLNNNRLFDDDVDVAGVDYPVSGVRTTVGITPRPATLSNNSDCDFLIFPGTSGGTETVCRDPGPRGYGRQSWRQVH